jgi:Xaa-Pro aminopeptidase
MTDHEEDSHVTGESAEFPREEYEARWRRAWELLDAEGLAALLVCHETNYRYLTGHCTYAWVSRSRPLIAVIAPGREPITVTAELELEIIRQSSWIDDARTYLGFDAEALTAVVDLLRELGIERGKIGIDYGTEMRLGMPITTFAELKRALPGAEFRDAARLLWQMRSMKSAREIEKIRASCIATERGLMRALFDVRPGQSEESVHRRMHLEILSAGADDVPFLPVHSGPGHYLKFGMGPTGRLIEPGDIVWADPGARVDGYFSDLCRMIAVGRATEAQKSAYRQIHEVTESCVQSIHAGVPIARLVAERDRAFAKIGYEQHYARSGRMGHASGLDMTEPPSVSLEDQTVLAPGMVIHIEPKIARADGAFVLEEVVAVTENGPDRLSPQAPDRLPVVG